VEPLCGVDELAPVVPSWAIGPLNFGNPVGVAVAASTAAAAAAAVMGARWGSKKCRKEKHHGQMRST
jgi:hypothetical protein